jgi:pyrroloquinoline-quinone synthase
MRTPRAARTDGLFDQEKGNHMLIDRIDALIEERDLLTHPFYVKWTAGTLPRENLLEYARQYYAFESYFPRCISAIHARTPQREVRQALLDNLWDEEHGDANHAELWLRFAEALGAPRTEVLGALPKPTTQELVETYRSIAAEAPVGAAVAALYAYERQVPAVAQAKIAGLRAFYGISDGPGLEFFETHSSLDVGHAAAERQIVEDLGQEDQETVVEVSAAALDAWWRFLDGIDAEA